MKGVSQHDTATVFWGGPVLIDGEARRGLAVVVEGGRVRRVEPEARRARSRARRSVDLDGAHLAPGLVDIHTHGAIGIDFYRADREGLERAVSEHYLPLGVTSLLVSLYPGPRREFLATVERLAGDIRSGAGRGAIAGFHLEGPFLNPKKPGALPSKAFAPIDLRSAAALIDAAGGLARTMTVAAELPRGSELVRLLRKRRVRPFLGHTDADFETAAGAFRRGVKAVTHLFNALNGIHHRAPGPATAALLDPSVAVELIADGFHVHPAVLKLVLAVKPPSKVCLVSDSVAPAGLRQGRYDFAGAPVKLQGGRVTLLDGTLAGSALTLDHAIRMVAFECGAGLPHAVQMATASPADAAGIAGAGRIQAGACANFAVLDAKGRVRATYLRGERVFER